MKKRRICPAFRIFELCAVFERYHSRCFFPDDGGFFIWQVLRL